MPIIGYQWLMLFINTWILDFYPDNNILVITIHIFLSYHGESVVKVIQLRTACECGPAKLLDVGKTQVQGIVSSHAKIMNL